MDYYKKLIQASLLKILTPTRVSYSLFDLLPLSSQLQRDDFLFQSYSKIACSLYTPTTHSPQTLLVFLHGNSGCRVDSNPLVKAVISKGWAFLCFDFPGCGHSQGSQLTMGIKQQELVRELIIHMKNMYKFKQIMLWGRSMGAVTALRTADQKELGLAGVVADSPFISFKRMLTQFLGNRYYLPQFIASPLITYLFEQYYIKSAVDLNTCHVVDALQNAKTPIILVCSTQDNIIDHRHSQQIYELVKAKKQIVRTLGSHCEQRSQQIVGRCLHFLENGRKNSIGVKSVGLSLYRDMGKQGMNYKRNCESPLLKLSKEPIKIKGQCETERKRSRRGIKVTELKY